MLFTGARGEPLARFVLLNRIARLTLTTYLERRDESTNPT